MNREHLVSMVKGVTPSTFASTALALFRFQFRFNAIYRSYVEALRRREEDIQDLYQIPFLPISFFKTHPVVTGKDNPLAVFESSSTTGQTPSKHWVMDWRMYEWSFLQHFIQCYGHPSQYRILALLPSYLERGNSSLVYMVEYIMKTSGHPHNAFYLNDFDLLADRLAEKVEVPTILIGVTFALLDFTEKYPFALHNTVIIETGGMKGRAREPIRSEVHDLLRERTKSQIHSEYGMTELFSQAYALSDQTFYSPDWMRVLTREVDDPLTVQKQGGRGALNIVDLANIDSCAFIATDDLGEVLDADRFKVLGRLTTAETRGCSLLYS